MSISIWDKMKYIKERGEICELCGYDKYPQILEAHHKTPTSERGSSEPENIIILCPNCHRLEHYKDRSFGIYNYKKSINEYHKRWAKNNPLKLKEQSKRKYKKNKKKIDAYNKEWAKNNKEKRKIHMKTWYDKNKKKIENIDRNV